jgi:hypothetical protein
MRTEAQGWERRGLVYAPPGTGNLRSHGMLPTPFLMSDRIRVFFAACDELLRGRIYYIDVDRSDPRQVIGVSDSPVLDIGSAGSFDEHGVNPSQILVRDGKLFLYYIGWERISESVPYTLFAGLCISDDLGQSFRRHGIGQILHPTPVERYFRTAPFVFEGEDGWEMLYVGGGTFFDGEKGKRLPIYSLCLTHSMDGYVWEDVAASPILSPERSRGEIGFGRPVLWREQGRASLIISVRTEQGYELRSISNSPAGLRQIPVLDRDAGDWEVSMTCFGSACVVDGWEYLFYNGNQFGRSGFGLARRELQAQADQQTTRELITALSHARTLNSIASV